MKQVRIVMDGEYGNVQYKIGEIWDVTGDQDYGYWNVERNGKRTIVKTEDTTSGKKEAEVIEQPVQLPIFN